MHLIFRIFLSLIRARNIKIITKQYDKFCNPEYNPRSGVRIVNYHYFCLFGISSPSFLRWQNSSFQRKNISCGSVRPLEYFLWPQSSQTGLCRALVRVTSSVMIMCYMPDKYVFLWTFPLRTIGKNYPSTEVSKLERYKCRASGSHFVNHCNSRDNKRYRIWRSPRT